MLRHAIGDLKQGSVVYLLSPIGEGYYRVWHRGNVLELEVLDAPKFPYQWWAKLKLKSGQIVWLNMGQSHFGHIDACA